MKKYLFFPAFILSIPILITACYKENIRDDSRDRSLLQTCLNNGGEPIYTEQVNGYYDTTVITFIACDNGVQP